VFTTFRVHTCSPLKIYNIQYLAKEYIISILSCEFQLRSYVTGDKRVDDCIALDKLIFNKHLLFYRFVVILKCFCNTSSLGSKSNSVG